MERFIAIDNVCAWPRITLMPDETIISAIYNQPVHGEWEGDVECWASSNGGRTWQFRGVVAAHDEPQTCRLNDAAGLAHNGSLVVIVGGMTNAVPPGEKLKEEDRLKLKFLPTWICHSFDGGRSWERTGTVNIPEGMPNLIPFGGITKSPDGTLGLSCYSHYGDDVKAEAFFLRSRDDGRSWGELVLIGAENYNETALLCLDERRWLAACRVHLQGHLELFASEDGGQSWTNRGPLTLGWQHPGNLLKLKDGRILLTYGIRNRGLYGIGARLSDDQGTSWSPPVLLLDLQDARDGGYPSSVQLQDGTIVTAYYADRIKAHRRYHMGVLRWRADFDWKTTGHLEGLR